MCPFRSVSEQVGSTGFMLVPIIYQCQSKSTPNRLREFGASEFNTAEFNRLDTFVARGDKILTISTFQKHTGPS